MRTLRTLLLALALALAPLAAGCGGGDDDNIFVGTWFAADGSWITFGNDTWLDADGDAGDYSYTGDYPVYVVTFVLPSGPYARQATFVDEHTMTLCEIFVTGALGGCVELVRDRPIAPG